MKLTSRLGLAAVIVSVAGAALWGAGAGSEGALAEVVPAEEASYDWTQWGGPNRDFILPQAGPLATEWPESGPKELWSKPFGDGFSAILYEDGRLYTMRRQGDSDVVVSLDAETGETLWETSYDSPTTDDMVLDFGPGPISTPLIAGDRLYTVSSTVKFHCLDKKDGKILWSHDLRQELQASHLGRGYGPSPIAYDDLVILGVGGQQSGVVAFDQASGEIRWKTDGYPPSYSSPILVNFGGRDMLIISMGPARAGLDPSTGEVIWRLDTPKVTGSMMSTQHFGEDHILFGSMAYGGGSRAIKLKKEGGDFIAEELWYTRRMRVMYASFVRIGDYIYGSSGDFGPAFLQCLNIHDGKIMWRKRGFSRSHLVQVGDQVLILDEDGDLAIATATPDDLTVHAQANILERTAWTPPTVIGSTVYVRNRKEIKALDLSR
ncbi:MAG TPA: PQQ-binding-like beta-propeller repeat protein [Acidobacteriota bacterium]|nr:PQQ-binding-like beta-propeller repeat protein [Acidobacteriota bacterium]